MGGKSTSMGVGTQGGEKGRVSGSQCVAIEVLAGGGGEVKSVIFREKRSENFPLQMSPSVVHWLLSPKDCKP